MRQLEEACWGLPTAIQRWVNYVSTLTLDNRTLGGEGRGKRGDWEQGHTIHGSLLGSKEFFSNCDITELHLVIDSVMQKYCIEILACDITGPYLDTAL